MLFQVSRDKSLRQHGVADDPSPLGQTAEEKTDYAGGVLRAPGVCRCTHLQIDTENGDHGNIHS
jgi:hypothetical protein